MVDSTKVISGFPEAVSEIRAFLEKRGITGMEGSFNPGGHHHYLHRFKNLLEGGPTILSLVLEFERPAASVVLCKAFRISHRRCDTIMLDLEYDGSGERWSIAYKSKFDVWDGQLSRLARRHGVRTIGKRYPLLPEQAWSRMEELIAYHRSAASEPLLRPIMY